MLYNSSYSIESLALQQSENCIKKWQFFIKFVKYSLKLLSVIFTEINFILLIKIMKRMYFFKNIPLPVRQ